MRVTVASGKGGTGKTLVATNLAWLLGETGEPAVYVDADVEEPNGGLFLHPQITSAARETVLVPAMRVDACSGCGRCQERCASHALLVLGRRVKVFPQLCHGCGACIHGCPEHALVESWRAMGTVHLGRAGRVGFVEGVLDVGEPRPPPLIRAAIHRGARLCDDGVLLIDAPPGTACPATTAVRAGDLVVLVSEPTPFGCHDLELALALCRAVGAPVVAVLNRADLGDDRTAALLERERIPIVATIRFDRQLAAACAEGRLAAADLSWFRSALEPVARFILDVRTGANA